MAINHAVDAYKQQEYNYVEGINSAHGRVTLLFDTLLNAVDKLIEKHPKTEFISFGKSINSINILINSLNPCLINVGTKAGPFCVGPIIAAPIAPIP